MSFLHAVYKTLCIDSAQPLVPVVRAFTLLMGRMIEGSRGNEARVANKGQAGRFRAGLAVEWRMSNNLGIYDKLCEYLRHPKFN